MFQQDLATVTLRERLQTLDSPEGKFRREWMAYREIDRLKQRINEVRQSLQVARAQ
ncbi:MAG TPA: hypothetical protein PJ994_01365 [Tepidiformaceae bacterium]|nr:hypothetical protein [Tepidiformaceae bacterium]HMO96325.1 hypothetical protein [Tepidiformaceae bacterium]